MPLADARRCAYEYIRDISTLFEGDKRKELIQLSDIYKEIYKYINELLNKLPCAKTVDKSNAREIWTVELRNEQADILDKVLILEKNAEKKAREILVLIKKERDKLKPELLEPKIIKKRGIIVAGICGNGNETAKLWQEYEQLEQNNPLKNKVDDWGYEVRLYDEAGKFECYVGACVDKAVTQSGYSSIILTDNILYAVFDIYPIEGYESQNKFMDNWLEKNKDKYEQYKIDDRYFAVEYYGEKFKGNDDIESVVEIWIPIINN